VVFLAAVFLAVAFFAVLRAVVFFAAVFFAAVLRAGAAAGAASAVVSVVVAAGASVAAGVAAFRALVRAVFRAAVFLATLRTGEESLSEPGVGEVLTATEDLSYGDGDRKMTWSHFSGEGGAPRAVRSADVTAIDPLL
jgi:hypothetical protein